ncbi:MAG: tetratricopeptide repeat protein [bacterium]|nr:tetratricopeptide repeat protein [bacterium]
MNEVSWLPGIVALVVGLATGLGMAFRLRRRASFAQNEQHAGDLRLRIADLEERRDDLYRRLRGEELATSEVLALERAAARTLRDLDEARAQLTKVSPKEAEKKKPAAGVAGEEPTPQTQTPQAAFRHPLLVGFSFGAAMVALVGVLIYWAIRDAAPKPEAVEPGARSEPAEGMPVDHPEVAAGMSPEIEARLAELRAQLESDPSDLMARKELALVLLNHNQFFPAFQQAEEILRAHPDDPDGLYVAGVVRFTMGQADVAIELMDRVLAQYPDHVLALLVRGLAFMRLGDRLEAIASWERGLEAAGGQHPQLEEFLATARAAESQEPSSIPEERESAPARALPAEEGMGSSEPPASGTYRMKIELASGARVVAGATLFVSLSTRDNEHPAAVERIPDPVFPMEIVLDSGDSMMGEELPAAGVVTIRLDADGNVATKGELDLVVQVEARSGSTTHVVLK